MQFRRISKDTVQAMQLTLLDLDEIKEFLENNNIEYNVSVRTIEIKPFCNKSTRLQVFISDWIVIDNNNYVQVYGDYDFANMFEVDNEDE